MDVGECPLAEFGVEQVAQQLELGVGVAQPVAVGQEENFAVELGGEWLLMQDDATLALQVVEGPDVVVACEIVDLYPHVGELRKLAEEARIALGYYVLIFKPVVEHIAQQVHRCRLLLDAVKEAYQSPFLHPPVVDGPRTEMSIR